MQTDAGRPVLVVACDELALEELMPVLSGLGVGVEVATHGEEALQAAERSRPGLVVLSVDLSAPSGFEVLHRLRVRFGGDLAIVLVGASVGATARDEVAALLLGADDYFARPLQFDAVLARMRRLLSRPRRPLLSNHGGSSRIGELTRREREVLALLVAGERADEIRQRLSISRKTTATHIERILGKLGAHSQAQAVAFAVRDGVLESAAVVSPSENSQRIAREG